MLQAAGRVIRTESDRGIIALLDDRVLQNSYKSLYPREWNKLTRVDVTNSEEYVSEFWEECSGSTGGSHK